MLDSIGGAELFERSSEPIRQIDRVRWVSAGPGVERLAGGDEYLISCSTDLIGKSEAAIGYVDDLRLYDQDLVERGGSAIADGRLQDWSA